jgi:predicted transcriptional regulator
MPQLQELIQGHLASRNLSARAFAERTGVGYPTVLALLARGSVPRKAEHREALRRELGLDQESWAAVIAASQKDGIDIPSEGPLTLRQLVLKALLAQGFTEQSFAKVSGVPYATLMGLTRKGAIPRAETLATIAEGLGLARDEVDAAVAYSRAQRDEDPSGTDAVVAEELADDAPEPQDLNGDAREGGEAEVPNLAQLVADRIAAHGVSVAAFGKQHGIPYISLHRLIASGVPPRRRNALEPLARALGLAEQLFETSLMKSKRSPIPATAPSDEEKLTPLQEALRRVVRHRNLTTKAFAELADLSVLTATKLLKHGDLPGRATTHEKLRTLLQLTADEYHDLVRRSRGAVEAERAPNAAPVPVPVAVAGTPGAAGAEQGPTVAELAELIERLNPRQRSALKQFILTMI